VISAISVLPAASVPVAASAARASLIAAMPASAHSSAALTLLVTMMARARSQKRLIRIVIHSETDPFQSRLCHRAQSFYYRFSRRFSRQINGREQDKQTQSQSHDRLSCDARD
jgi:hypothetical protein